MTRPADGATGRPWLVWACAAVFFAIQMGFGPRYPMFRDEFYYLACADRLAWGYVDHPPLSIAVLAAWKALFGDSLVSLRVLPSLAGAATVVLVSDLAGVLGGSAFARTLAAVAVLAAPTLYGITGFYSMNAFDFVLWLTAAVLLARLARAEPAERARRWPWLGLVLGLGLLNKLSVGALGAGVAAALLLTSLRSDLRTRGPWLALAIAAVLFAPHVVWQAQHGWPTLEFMRNASRYKNVALGPVGFVLEQVRDIGPWNVLLWLPGFLWLGFGGAGRFRALAVVFLVAFAAFMNGKAYYMAPAMLILLAAGAVVAAQRLAGPRLGWVRAAVLVLLVVLSSVALPLAAPVLSPEGLTRYMQTLGMIPRNAERNALGQLPQHFADRFGWQELTAITARAWDSLTPEEQRRTIIVTSNYGEAGALDYYGRALGLPPARSQHNNYYLWGPGDPGASIVITVGISTAGLAEVFDDVQPVAALTDPRAMPYEREHPVAICRGLKSGLTDIWARGRHYI